MKKIIVFCILLVSLNAHAKQINTITGEVCDPKSPERGWWFNCEEEEKKKEDKKPSKTLPMQPLAKADNKPKPKPKPKNKKIDCSDPKEWDLDKCGFVNPKKDWDFQKRQRELIVKNMSMSPENPVYAKAYIQYMAWVMRQASKAIATNRWLTTQDQSLDYRTQIPTSTLGLKMQTVRDKNRQKDYWEAVKREGGELVMFSRASCDYCHQAAPMWISLAKDLGLKISDAALDDKCINKGKGFDSCITGEKARLAGGLLGIKYVPALLLYVPYDKDDLDAGGTWIKLANNFEIKSRIKKRLFLFLTTVRNEEMNKLRDTLSLKGVLNEDITKE